MQQSFDTDLGKKYVILPAVVNGHIVPASDALTQNNPQARSTTPPTGSSTRVNPIVAAVPTGMKRAAIPDVPPVTTRACGGEKVGYDPSRS